MKKHRTRMLKLDQVEQLDLFAEKTIRPTWASLPSESRNRISELIAQMLFERLQANNSSNDRKEVAHER